MINLSAKVVQLPPTAEKIYKNIKFGTAVGMTRTAKQGQAAVQSALRRFFTIRNRWLEQQTPIGIKIKPATKDDMQSIVRTAARFLPLQASGGIKFPYKNYLAIPADAGPLKGKRVIPKAMRPRALKNAFILVTKNGTRLLCVRGLKTRGKYKGVTPMYVLVPKGKIKQVDFWEKPLRDVVNRHLTDNISKEIDNALRTMK